MPITRAREGIRNILARIEPKVESVLVWLSFLALALVATNEVVKHNFMVPLLSIHWADVHIWLRTAIWLIFVVDFLAYALLSQNRVSWVRRHVLEFVICATWFPYGSEGMLRQLTEIGYIANYLSVDVLQLVGTLAHGWRVVRWTGQRFGAHPLLVTGSAALLLIASAAALLHHFEPTTFTSFWDAAWYCLVTITTIGYGDLVPHTTLGRAIGVVLIISGISLAAVFIGLISDMVQQKLLNRMSRTADLSLLAGIKSALDKNNELQGEILDQLRTNNTLLVRLLEHSERSADDCKEQDVQR